MQSDDMIPMLSHSFTDQQVTVTHQEMLQSADKGSKEEDCEQLNMDVNNARFKKL